MRECVGEFGISVSKDIVHKLRGVLDTIVAGNKSAFTLKVLNMSRAISCKYGFKEESSNAKFVDWRYYYPLGNNMIATPVSDLAHMTTVVFTVEAAKNIDLNERIEKLQELSSAFNRNPSVTGFVLKGIVNGCLKFSEWPKDKFNVFVETRDGSAKPLDGWPTRPKRVEYFEEKFQFDGSQPTLLLPYSWRHPDVDYVIVYQAKISGEMHCFVVGIQITTKSPREHQKCLNFVEKVKYKKFVPIEFQDVGKHTAAILWIVPRAKMYDLPGGRPDTLQGVLELEYFESVCGVPVPM